MKAVTTFILFCLFVLVANVAFAETAFAEEHADMIANAELKPAVISYITGHSKKKLSKAETSNIAEELILAATEQGLPVRLLVALAATESGFNKRAATKEGARGIFQIIPKYHKALLKGRDVFNIKTNIEVGSKILKAFIVETGSEHKALYKYNGKVNKVYLATIAKKERDFDSLSIIMDRQPLYVSLN